MIHGNSPVQIHFIFSDQVICQGDQKQSGKVRPRWQGSGCDKIRTGYRSFIAAFALAPQQSPRSAAGHELLVRHLQHAICAQGLVGQSHETAREWSGYGKCLTCTLTFNSRKSCLDFRKGQSCQTFSSRVCKWYVPVHMKSCTHPFPCNGILNFQPYYRLRNTWMNNLRERSF